ncbi:Fibroblast growth factor receptor 2 [Folsomia candida]|uniref:Fibroblast growth factor receptor 2 n=1 Tax=Folsomia candida TaxID=158441 RepID=A0A226DT29_FOLCA|nr:Fibroblast growth factor receptor 2 [Folsomia candida]OXA48642.1 Fibroblast growth factor receptor 2 [Folsomia candida]
METFHISSFLTIALYGVQGTPFGLSDHPTRHGVGVPWHVHILVKNNDIVSMTYPGVLISPSMAITRARESIHEGGNKFHIFPYNRYHATVGTSNLGDPFTPDDDNENGIIPINITHIRIHPNFDGEDDQNENNFALIHFSKPVTLSSRVEPLCLPDHLELDEEDDLVVTGFTDLVDNPFLNLTTLSSSRCDELWVQYFNESNTTSAGKDVWCAAIDRNSQTCILGDVAAARRINGSFYLNGLIKHFYSRIPIPYCFGILFYFDPISSQTLEWIENNRRCGPAQFTCRNGDCFPLSAICREKPACLDWSEYLILNSDYCDRLNYCEEGSFPCGENGECIPGVEDCRVVDPSGNGLTVYTSVGIVSSIAVLGICGILILWRRHVLKLRSETRDLNKQEVRDFISGVTPVPETAVKPRLGSVSKYVVSQIETLPWLEEFDILMKQLQIEDEINRGSFGIVYAGWLHRDDGNIKVAIKTHIGNLVTEFKALLCEVKILAYLGHHENILKFYGACTERIKKREVYMVMEICENGNLRDFLASNAEYYTDTETSDEGDVWNSDAIKGYTLSDSQFGVVNRNQLLLWARQIAGGMEYLTTKSNIVHNDLAARNILLDSNLDAKISDFGFSRKLDDGGIYLKSTNEPIPWKWRSPETFTSKTFSQSSDVWAFGILLWELFSLGDEPYEDREWNDGFLNDLVGGIRLPQPVLASEIM